MASEASSRLREIALDPQIRSYEGSDPANATRAIGALWLLSGVLALLYLPLDSPADAIGAAGWAVALGVVAASLATGVWLLRLRTPASFNLLLGSSYVGLGSAALLVWLGGGEHTAYDALFLLWIGSAMGVHPVQRALPFLLVAVGVAALPFVYGPWNESYAAEQAARFMLWSAVGLIMLALMTYIRRQRVTLRDGRKEAEELARADALTGLGNRRGFDEALSTELGRAARAGSTASVVLIDLDRLKQINDVLSHLEGDRCLRQVADAISAQIRSGDRAFRWGGDEFAVLLPDTPSNEAQDVAARIALRISSTTSNSAGRPLTVAWGVAEAGEEMDAAELLDCADLALREQKHQRSMVDGAPEHVV